MQQDGYLQPLRGKRQASWRARHLSVSTQDHTTTVLPTTNRGRDGYRHEVLSFPEAAQRLIEPGSPWLRTVRALGGLKTHPLLPWPQAW